VQQVQQVFKDDQVLKDPLDLQVNQAVQEPRE